MSMTKRMDQKQNRNEMEELKMSVETTMKTIEMMATARLMRMCDTKRAKMMDQHKKLEKATKEVSKGL